MGERSEKEKGIVLSLLKRLVDQRLPRLLEMQARVDRGETISDSDVAYLEKALEDAYSNRRHVAQFPEYKSVIAKLIQLYGEILGKALENEKVQK